MLHAIAGACLRLRSSRGIQREIYVISQRKNDRKSGKFYRLRTNLPSDREITRARSDSWDERVSQEDDRTRIQRRRIKASDVLFRKGGTSVDYHRNLLHPRMHATISFNLNL